MIELKIDSVVELNNFEDYIKIKNFFINLNYNYPYESVLDDIYPGYFKANLTVYFCLIDKEIRFFATLPETKYSYTKYTVNSIIREFKLKNINK